MVTTYTERTKPSAPYWAEEQSPGEASKYGEARYGYSYYGAKTATAYTERTKPSVSWTERTKP